MRCTSVGVLATGLLLISLTQQADSERIEVVGNDVIVSEGGSNWQGTTFLFNNIALHDGVVFAFSAYFVNRNPVDFQIWRPVDISNNRFKLIKSWTIIPANSHTKEDVYIHTRQDYKCMEVLSSDRLGIYSPVHNGSVAWTFDTQAGSAFQHTERNLSAQVQPGEEIRFDSLEFPYSFSAAAYVDTDLSQYTDLNNPECPKQLQIPYKPITTTVAPPITGPPGAVGATGPKGEKGEPGAWGEKGEAGEVGATGERGPIGDRGQMGDRGPQGQQGERGPMGYTGEIGPDGRAGATGPAGPAGPAGPVGAASLGRLEEDYEECDWCWNFLNPYMSLALLLWLVIITVVIIVLVAVYSCKSKRDNLHYTDTASTRWAGSNADLWKTYNSVTSPDQKMSYENGAIDIITDDGYQSAYVIEGRTEL